MDSILPLLQGGNELCILKIILTDKITAVKITQIQKQTAVKITLADIVTKGSKVNGNCHRYYKQQQ